MKQAIRLTRLYGPPVTMVLAGAYLLFAATQAYDWIDLIWPVLIILAGLPPLLIAWHAKADQERRIRLVYPGLIITGTGILLQYQLITDNWHTWTYAWALYAVLFGMGSLYQGRRQDNKDDVRSGRLLIGGGLAGFVVMAIVMETIVFSGISQGILSYVLGGLLIGGGLVWGGNRWRINREAAPTAQETPAEVPTKATEQEEAPQPVDPLQARKEKLRKAAQGISDEATHEPEHKTEPQQPQTTAPSNASESDADNADNKETVPDIQDYKPPKDIKVDGEEPSPEIDPDLKARIDAALSEDEEK